MTRRPRRNHSAAFRAKVAIARSRSLPHTSTSIPIRSQPGSRSSKAALPMFSVRVAVQPLQHRPPSCSTGTHGACCHGAYRSRWRRHSASRHSRTLWPRTASRRSSTPTRARSSPVRICCIKNKYSRRVLSWRVSITMEASFCVETLEDALATHSKPEIFNTDQGSQFTCPAFAGVLAANDVKMRMDGKGAWQDNVLRRAALAQRKIRGGLFARLRLRQRGPHQDRALSRILQSPPPAFEP